MKTAYQKLSPIVDDVEMSEAECIGTPIIIGSIRMKEKCSSTDESIVIASSNAHIAIFTGKGD